MCLRGSPGRVSISLFNDLNEQDARRLLSVPTVKRIIPYHAYVLLSPKHIPSRWGEGGLRGERESSQSDS